MMYEGITYGQLGYGLDVAPSSVALGEGWGTLESGEWGLFRTVSGRAHALFAAVGTVYAVKVDLEPAKRGDTLDLDAYADGTLRCSKRIVGRSLVRFLVPPSEPAIRRLSLEVNGGRARVFQFAAMPFVRDVVHAWEGVRVGGGGWYMLEELPPDMFRWVYRAGEIVIERPQRSLQFDVEPGPGLGGSPLQLEVALVDGPPLGDFRIERRTRISVELPAFDTLPVRLLLRCEGGGRPQPGDARICDFRVFSIPAPWERRELLRSLAALAPG